MRAKYVVLIILTAVFIILVLVDRKIKLNKKKEQLESITVNRSNNNTKKEESVSA